jgi:signal transduction histidine kinase
MILPAALVLIAMMVFLMVPQAGVQSTVTQIKEGLSEVVAAEGFARHYQRQLRECAAFIATGSAEHERLFEQARQNAQVDMGKWIQAETAHTGDSPEEHRQEIKAHDNIMRAFTEVSKACDWAVAVARSGQPVAAMNYLEQVVDGPDGSVVSEGLDEQVPEEEAQLSRYLDNLKGQVDALSAMRVIGVQPTVENMRHHVANTILAEQFAKYYNTQVQEFLEYVVTGNATSVMEIEEARESADRALEGWAEQAEQLGKTERGKSTLLVNRLDDQYGDINKSWEQAVKQINSGDAAAALAMVESKTGPTVQNTLTPAINNEVDSQKKALESDAGYISNSSSNASWGVGILGTLLLLVAFGGALLISRTVVVPVVNMRDAVRKFGEGDSSVEVKVKSRDELGELADNFNAMATARVTAENELREARDDLEDRVQERTKELAQANEELATINKELSDFAYVVSHDLKAPLRGIGSLATWLATDYEDVLDDTGKQQLQLLLDRAKRMETLIESILQYSRVGRLHESLENVDMNELVNSAIQMLSPPDNVSIMIEGRLPRVLCERTRMEQVLLNLLSNAIKFMDKPVGLVTVACEGSGDMWRFSVTDNGCGIDSRYYDQIFQIFQTLNPVDDKQSTGIGLTLVKKIVEMHGGTTWVESEVGKGSTFYFTLPRT